MQIKQEIELLGSDPLARLTLFTTVFASANWQEKDCMIRAWLAAYPRNPGVLPKNTAFAL
ncbi:MAG: hypothetical protein Tsb0015_12330 [Simkaniaceae bacterium]